MRETQTLFLTIGVSPAPLPRGFTCSHILVNQAITGMVVNVLTVDSTLYFLSGKVQWEGKALLPLELD